MGLPDLWKDSMDPGRFGRAVGRAAELHRDQLRKGTSVPYLSHLLAVAALVAEDEGSEDEVVAALFHDAAEDQGGQAVIDELRREYGDGVADIVEACSDSLVADRAQKAPWRERKEEAVRLLPTRSDGALRVIAADKLHNTRATAADLRIHGPGVWGRFKTGREGFLWYHQQVADELVRLLPSSRSATLLQSEVADLAAGEPKDPSTLS